MFLVANNAGQTGTHTHTHTNNNNNNMIGCAVLRGGDNKFTSDEQVVATISTRVVSIPFPFSEFL